MRTMLIVFCLLFTLNVQAIDTQAIILRPDYPKRYVVQRGDTLWSIANKFLNRPWEWQALLHANPTIRNPNKLYPGALLEIRYYQRNPYLKVLSNGTIKLSPYARPMLSDDAIPAIPLTDIKPFFNASLVMDQDRLAKAPYVVAYIGEHLLGGQGDEVYVKNLHPSQQMPVGATISYAVYRPLRPYLEPETKEILGFNATIVGYGVLARGGEPATMLLTEITEGVKLKDRVMLNDFPDYNLYFEPKTPISQVRGVIIDLPGGYTQGAVGSVAVINRGDNAKLQSGDVLGIYTRKRIVNDPKCPEKKVILPRERVGELMVFRVFSKTSFALVVRSISTIHILDAVTNP